jgi:hypothetical protein
MTGSRKLDALKFDMPRFDFVRDIFDGVFKNFNPLKWLRLFPDWRWEKEVRCRRTTLTTRWVIGRLRV